MKIRELSIMGALELTPSQFSDARGMFSEWFRSGDLAATIGHSFSIAQANCSVSRRGVLRGIHFADVPPSQAKYVYCPSGAVLDVVVDIRVGSRTFGQWDSVMLDTTDRRAIYIAEGLGHAFMALTEAATVVYLCSEPFAPGREHGIHPLDPELDIAWPAGLAPVLSDKDAAAPSLAEAIASDLLPTFDHCAVFYAGLK